MSEAEKILRLNYKQNRNKWILIQATVLAALMLLSVIMLFVYNRLDRTYYIEYSESGGADYTVNLKDSDFFPEGSLESNRGYISELISSIYTRFNYQMVMNSQTARYEYDHYVDATLRITNDRTGRVLYEQTDILTEKEKGTSDQNKFAVAEFVTVDYVKYNTIAEEFISTYGLKSVSATLSVSMHVGVMGNCSELQNVQQSSYVNSILIPLNEQMVDITNSSSSPSGEVKVLACKSDVNPTVFKVLAIVLFILALLTAGILAGFVYITRNEDINYEIKIKRIVNSYRSYIQTATNGFDFEGYQMVRLASFVELLGVRDTTQFPILMVENEDKTKTEFFVPTNTKIVYIFEIRVENYDDIYNPKDEVILPEEEPKTQPEEAIIIEQVDEEELAAAMAEPDIDLSKIDYVEDDSIPEAEDGVEVIGVVWPEKTKKNKVYKYDPNGETVEEGDIVLVPSRDVHRGKDVIRKAAVAHANYRVDEENIHFPLKKIIGVVKKGLKSHLEK